MKTFKNLALLVIAVLFATLTSCERVSPNYQGVLMTNWGQNGKSDFELKQGRVNTMSPGTELFQVPLFEQRAGFEEGVRLKAADNTEFKSTPTYSYSVIKERAVNVVFQNKRLGAGDDFMRAVENNILEPKIYDIMKEASRSFLTDDLMATGGSLKYEKHVEELIKKEFEARGLSLTTFSCQLEFSKAVTEKIDSRNEVNTNITVLDQQIEEQKKRNELEQLVTEQAIIRSKGLTPEILREKEITKWDGKLPSTVAGQSGISIIKNVN